MSEALDRLTEPQRACLRLVGQGYESKEIARKLGISFYAVDTRLARAVQTLGVRGRREAARLLEAHERRTSERPVYEAPHDVSEVVTRLSDPERDRTEEPSDFSRDAEAGSLRSQPRPKRAFRWPIPTAGRRTNDLNMPAVLFWTGTGALVIGLLVLGLVAIAVTAHDQVSRFFS